LEYEKCETYEAKVVKDLDKLEMIQQAYEYEK
jgi:5'-deoxynucleotidase YfbR-like HD superfamily hydrolase